MWSNHHRSTSAPILSILSGSAWTLLGRLAFGASVLLQNSIYARLLGPHDLGVVLLIQSIVLPAAIFAVFGLDLASVRDLRDPREASNRLCLHSFLRSSVLVIFGTSCVSFLIVYSGLRLSCASSALTCSQANDIAPLLGALILLSALQLLLAGMLRALGRMAAATFSASVLAAYIGLLVTGGALWAGLSISIGGAFSIQVVCLLIAAAVSLLAVIKAAPAATGAKVDARKLLAGGPSMMATQILALLVTQSDVWVLGMTHNAAAIAQYGVASRLAQLVSLPHLALGGVLPPLIARCLADGKRENLEYLTRLSVTFAVAPSLLLALTFFICGGSVLELAFGPYYAAAYVPLIILSLGNVFNVACGPCSQALILSGHQNVLNTITLCVCAVCIAGGTFASARYGAIGLACVYAFALILQGCVAAFATFKLVHIRTYAGHQAVTRAFQERYGAGHVAS